MSNISVFIIVLICILLLWYIPFKWKKDYEKVLDEMRHKMEGYRIAQSFVISFTIHKGVSAEVVRFWDSEARKLSDEMSLNHDEIMLELEIDTSWWKE